MSRPVKMPALSFEDAMTIHVLRAEGFTYSALCKLVGDNAGRVTQVLDGRLYPESWETALERLMHGHYWHPRIVALILAVGDAAPVIAAVKAADPARRRYRQSLKRMHKFTVPFCRRHARGVAA